MKTHKPMNFPNPFPPATACERNLHLLTSYRPENFELFLRLHAYGDNPDVQLPGKIGRRAMIALRTGRRRYP